MNATIAFREVTADNYGTTGYVITRAEGLVDAPDLVVSDLSVADMDGVIAGPAVYAGRTIRLGLALIAEGHSAQALLDQALRSFIRGHDTLTVSWPWLGAGRSLIMDVECRKRVVSLDRLYDSGHARVDLEFLGAWPFWQDAAQSSANTIVATATGLTFDVAFDLDFGGTYSSGVAYCNNDGTAPAWPVVTITVTIACPNGLSLIARWGSTVTEFKLSGSLAAGDVVAIDMRAHTITRNNFPEQSLRDTTSDWLVLLPGSTTIQLAIPQGQATAVVVWRSSWL